MASSHRPSGSVVNERCPYLASRCAQAPGKDAHASAPRPSCTCLLAQELVRRLLAGRPRSRIVAKLMEERRDGRQEVICGPDEMLIMADWCTIDRCEGSCLRHYGRLLDHYDLDTSPPMFAPEAAA